MHEVDKPLRDLVFVGGGHAHALALRALAMNPVRGLRITLVSPSAFTPYSGMLPGLMAGHYSFEETHIDLARLCQWARVRFLRDTVIGLNPERRRLRCRERGELDYDILSLDIGSQPELASVPGAREYAVPVKPVSGLWERWTRLAGSRLDAQRIAVVGGGAGSVEVVLAMAHRLGPTVGDMTLYSGAEELLPGYSAGARRRVEEALARHGITVRCAHRVSRVTEGCLHFGDGESAAFDTLIWCTGAAAAPWIAASGLAVDERGFLLVEDTLQSVTRPEIFAAGDIATQRRHPRPKAGVYAVRQGPVLARNLAAFASAQPLREHRPQTRFLSLLSLGKRCAVAERHGLSVAGDWVWRWKDRIDRSFMQRFYDLPVLAMQGRHSTRIVREAEANDPLDGRSRSQAPCGGCGAKVGATELHQVLASLRGEYPQFIATAEELDDAARLTTNGTGLQSVDALRPLVDDPWLMGAIAAQHALSDLYACGATPSSAQALLTLPFAAPSLLRRDLRAVLAGALSVLAPAACRLIGGHTMQGPELQIAFAVNGIPDSGSPLNRHGAGAGDALLLTRPIGSGVLFAAHMQTLADGRNVEHALDLMRQGNARGAQVARRCAATALTDVTGFGLAGHLAGMLGEELQADLALEQLPLLPGTRELLAAGVRSTLHGANREAMASRVEAAGVSVAEEALLYDPQTSGGLLMAVPEPRAEEALALLAQDGPGAALIGRLRRREAGAPSIRLLGAG
ncbi:MAG: selenide, water dikinase SelD [Pseudomonadota bacterium]